MEAPDREIPSRHLGELVMDALKQIDSVAYVRFASVYRDFKDLPDFVKALEGLMPAAAVPPAPRLARPEPPVLRAPPPEAPPPQVRPAPPVSEPLPFKSTPLFPGLAPERPGPPKRRKSR
jgi:transcriptional repressor NrdR